MPSNVFLIPLKHFGNKIAKLEKQMKNSIFDLEIPEAKKVFEELRHAKYSVMNYTNHMLYFAMDDDQKKYANELANVMKNRAKDPDDIKNIYDEYYKLLVGIKDSKALLAFGKNAVVDVSIISAIIAATVLALKGFSKGDDKKKTNKHNVINHLRYK